MGGGFDARLRRLDGHLERDLLVTRFAQLGGDRLEEPANVLGVVAAEARREGHPRDGFGAEARRPTFVTFGRHVSDRTTPR